MAARRKHYKLTKKVIGALVALAVALLCMLLTATGTMATLLLWFGIDLSVTLPAEGTLEAHFIDVGNADAVFVTCGGQNLLIDAGEKADGDVVVDYLRSHGVERLDAVIATHADADHIGGMKTVVNAFPIDRFVMAFMPEGYEPTTSTYLNLLAALDERGVSVTDAQPQMEWALGEARVTILGPVEDATDKNEQSVVCRVTHGSQRMLFVGDAGKEEESSLLAAGVDLRADLLKVGHHGSRGSSTDAFLRAVGASAGVISCGAGNDYGHPHKEALLRLDAAGVTVYRTDEHGTIVAVSDGDTIKIQLER